MLGVCAALIEAVMCIKATTRNAATFTLGQGLDGFIEGGSSEYATKRVRVTCFRLLGSM